MVLILPISIVAILGILPLWPPQAVGPSDPTPNVIASGLSFPEGPALSLDGKVLYVVNVKTAAISRIDLVTRQLESEWVTLPGKGRGNGATMGPDGALYVADVGNKAIDRIDLKTKQITIVVDKNETGGALRGPNDLVFDKKGGIYFTEPYGSSKDHPIGTVYYKHPNSDTVSLVASGLAFPNGLALSPDQNTLFVAETPLGQIDAIDLTPNGIVPPGRKQIFCHVGGATGPDGMRFGPDGHLYAAIFGDGVVVNIAPDGKIIKRIPVGVGNNVTNLCFAADGQSIYVTETQSNSIVQIALS